MANEKKKGGGSLVIVSCIAKTPNLLVYVKLF